MTERTITEADLHAVLTAVASHNMCHFKDVMNAAFPPPFTPKEGEIIQVSDYKDFSNIKVRVFSHIDDDTGTYECFGNGCCVGTANNTIAWLVAKPQTPTQKGES
jgi:hypothetical protein